MPNTELAAGPTFWVIPTAILTELADMPFALPGGATQPPAPVVAPLMPPELVPVPAAAAPEPWLALLAPTDPAPAAVALPAPADVCP